MKFDLEFDYPVSYVRHKCRNPEHAVFRNSVEIEIEELPADAGRLVFAVGCRDLLRDQSLRLGREDCLFLIEERAPRFLEIDGRLYRERCKAGELADLTNTASVLSPFSVAPRESEELKTLVSQAGYSNDKVEIHDRESLTRKVLKDHHRGLSAKSIPPEGIFRSFKDDAGAAMKALIRERAQELKIVDGSVFAPASEPALFVSYTGASSDEFTHYIGVCESLDNGWSRFGSGAYHPLYNGRVPSFSIADLDGAKESLQTQRGESCNHVDLSVIDYVDHAAVRFDPSVEFRSTAGDVAAILSESGPRLTPEIIGPLVRLRDVLRGSPNWTTPELVDAMREVLAAAPVDGLDPASFDNVEWDDALHQHSMIGSRHTKPWIDRSLVEMRRTLDKVDGSPMIAALGGTAPVPSSESGKLLAAEVVSDYDAALILTSLRSLQRLPERTHGDILVAVESDSPGGLASRAERHAAVLFGTDGEVLAAIGKAGAPPAPTALALAKVHHDLVVRARVDLGVDGRISEDDLATLRFD